MFCNNEHFFKIAQPNFVVRKYILKRSANLLAFSFCILNNWRSPSLHNRPFPRSMRSQGKRPGCGSRRACRPRRRFRRIDVSLGNVDGSLFHIKIWFVMGHQDQYGKNWGNISQFAMWLSQSSVYNYKTDQSPYQFQHLAARFDSAMNKRSLPH